MIFQKKKVYALVPSTSNRTAQEIPNGLIVKCPQCSKILFSKDLEKYCKVCKFCDYHFRLSAQDRIEMTFDPGSFKEFDANMISEDPLSFPGYIEKLSTQNQISGLHEAVVTAEATIHGIPLIAAIMSFDYFAGTMGSVVGEKVTRAVEAASRLKLPLIIFSTSGGARMQESMLCLMQMAKTSSAIADYHDKGGLYISVITHPTYGGYPRALLCWETLYWLSLRLLLDLPAVS